jgi:hypothetical protein
VRLRPPGRRTRNHIPHQKQGARLDATVERCLRHPSTRNRG